MVNNRYNIDLLWNSSGAAPPLLPPPGLPCLEPGSVWLAGAGPGDPGLLTLHALNGLCQADFILHDALVDARILALARPGARLEFAGKRGGRPGAGQHAISARLITLARAGRRVLRLKGGDPFLFGRGGEEALALAQAGVPFRVIPGITSGMAGPAAAGIPVTHRGINRAVTFVTGHAAEGGAPGGLDWEALARGSPVLVFYMALSNLGEIAARLIAAGRAPSEPAAVISKATTPEERVLETTLARAAADTAAAGIEAPAVIIIGGVVRLRAALTNSVIPGRRPEHLASGIA